MNTNLLQALPASHQPPPVAKSRTLVRPVMLLPEADWKTALERNLRNQSLYNNMINEIFNGLTRIIGWTLIALVRLD